MPSGFKVVAAAMVILRALSAHAVESQTVKGHVPAIVTKLQPVDRLPATQQMRLSIGMPLRNPAGLSNLVQQIYNPASANYHRYLTTAQFTENFGPTKEDYQAIMDFATASGLTVTATHPNRLLLSVSGAVSDVEKAMHITLRRYRHPTESRMFYAPDTEPTLETRVSVLHISGLDDHSKPRAMSHRQTNASESANARPNAGSGPNGHYLGRDFRSAYVPGTALDGTGQVVGLFELDGYFPGDITQYESLAGLPNVPVQKILVDGFDGQPTASTGNEEVALDIEMAISMAPGLSSVIVYEASPSASTAEIDDLLNRMATDNLAKQLSCSWGFDIDAMTQQIFLQYAVQGQSFFLASGDNGSFGGPVLQPSDDPFITVVGGTFLTTSSTHKWTRESAWSSSGGGISTVFPIPSWQQGINMSANQGSTTMRNLPDVSMIADNVQVVADNGSSFPVVGTSIAAPLWAGFIALVNQQGLAVGKPPVGFINPAIYAIGKGPAYTASFHDVTTGNNASTSNPTNFFAVPGYDLCTGWGTPTGTNLINALLSPPFDDLVINPPFGFTAFGPVGGPFSLTSQVYTLTNAGTAAFDWMLSNTSTWLNVSPGGGTLLPGGPGTTVTVSLNAAASNFLISASTVNLGFTNLTSGNGQNLQFAVLSGNPGFEAGSLTNWSLQSTGVVMVDSIDMAALVGKPQIPGVDDSLFVHSGIYGAFLGQAGSLAHMSQSLPTTPGKRYAVSFWATNPTNGTPNEFMVSWNGVTLFDQTNMGQFGWTNFQYVVTATGPTTVLDFGFQNDPNAFGLDDVIVQPIPAPVFLTTTPSNGSVVFTWSAFPGIAYQLQSTPSLSPVGWNNLGGLVTATNDSATASDSIGSSSMQFYRLLVPP